MMDAGDSSGASFVIWSTSTHSLASADGAAGGIDLPFERHPLGGAGTMCGAGGAADIGCSSAEPTSALGVAMEAAREARWARRR